MVLGPWVKPQREVMAGQEGKPIPGPLVWRGFTAAPEGTYVVHGNLEVGGSLLIDLRVAEGQQVKRGDIIAVLSNYPTLDDGVRTHEALLAKAETKRAAVKSGYRTAEIAVQEAVTQAASDKYRLKALEMNRSSEAPDQKQLELGISQLNREREQAKLHLLKEALASDLAVANQEVEIAHAELEAARISREQALVRAPIDGVVVRISAHKGERVSATKGAVEIVDMSKLRVMVDIGVEHLGQIVKGVKVEVVFRGDRTVYSGQVVRVAKVVKKLLQTELLAFPVASDAHVVQVEIQLDDPARAPQILGREASVTFLPTSGPVVGEQSRTGAGSAAASR
jgi:multidrug resistance efflux pump